MSRPSFTIRYQRPALVLASVLLGTLAVDTMLWCRITTRLQTEFGITLKSANTKGWTIARSPSHRSGWPFGAIVEVPSLDAYEDDINSGPTQARTTIKVANLRLGGSWFTLLKRGPHLSMSVATLAHQTSNDATTIVHATDLTARIYAPGHVRVSASEARFVSPALNWNITAQHLAGRLIVNPKARRGETRFGADLHAITLNGIPLASITSAQNPHLAVALESAGPAAGNTLFRLNHYQKLYIQDISATALSSRIILSGTISLPDQNGTIVATLPEWHGPALRLADRLIGDPRLAPDLQNALHRTAEKFLTSPQTSHHPISIALPITAGRVEDPIDAISRPLTPLTEPD